MGEYLYETAWRCTQWDESSNSVEVGFGRTRNRGYHQCVFNCITSLRDGEISTLQTSLSEARSVFWCLSVCLSLPICVSFCLFLCLCLSVCLSETIILSVLLHQESIHPSYSGVKSSNTSVQPVWRVRMVCIPPLPSSCVFWKLKKQVMRETLLQTTHIFSVMCHSCKTGKRDCPT